MLAATPSCPDIPDLSPTTTILVSDIYRYQMQADVKYLQALFKTVVTGSKKGGLNLCSDVYLMFSSTNGAVCTALFRVKNSKTSNVNWTPIWSYTAYAGWSERASVR